MRAPVVPSILLRDPRMERRGAEAISRKQRLLTPAPARRILIQRLSPDCNIAGSFIQSCYSYAAAEMRRNVDWMRKPTLARESLERVGAVRADLGQTGNGQAGPGCHTPPFDARTQDWVREHRLLLIFGVEAGTPMA